VFSVHTNRANSSIRAAAIGLKLMNQQGMRVLIIDDEVESLGLLGMHLAKDGYEVLTATSGAEGLKLAFAHQPDAVILDIRLPGMDGLEVCGRLRDISDAAILIFTVVADAEHIVRGLQLGADDYISKPVAYKELAARLEACLRRRVRQGGIIPAPGPAGIVWKVDESRREVEIGGRRSQLTPKEFEVFKLLMQNPDHVMAADEILKTVWGAEYLGDMELVKQFIYRLRAKLEVNPSEPRYFVTVRGSGYAFEPDTRPTSNGQLPPKPKLGEPPVRGRVSEFRQQAVRSHPSANILSVPASAVAETKPSLRRQARSPWGRLRVPQLAALALLLSLTSGVLLMGGMLALASGKALPGDGGYPLKLLLERVWLLATTDRERDLALRLEFLGHRVAEIGSLVAAGRAEQVPAAVDRLEGEIVMASIDLDEVHLAGGRGSAQIVEASLTAHIEHLVEVRGLVSSDLAPAITSAIEAARGLRSRALGLDGPKGSKELLNQTEAAETTVPDP